MAEELDRLIAELFVYIAKHEKEIANLVAMNATMLEQVYATLQMCDMEECTHAATHSCGGRTKRFLCDRHLADELRVHKTKDGFETVRKLWKELQNIVVVRALNAYRESLEGVVPKYLN